MSRILENVIGTVSISAVRESNVRARALPGLVVVFVGGTNGIGEATARELFQRATRPRAYIIGRNLVKGNELICELNLLNPDGEAFFLPKDISLLHNVDDVCAELKRRERKIHCLVLSAGYMSLQGRTETPEGIDHKMSVNYYARVRCILNLMPLLTVASDAGELSRVISILAAGSEYDVNVEDLDLRHDFTLHASLAHCVVMTDFIIEQLAKRFPGTSFSHSYPGTVKTGIANKLSGPVRLSVKVMYAVLTPWILNVEESGERHFFQMTSQCYPAASGGVGVPRQDGMIPFSAMDGTPGGGAYLLDWDGRPTGDPAVLNKYRDLGPKVWAHTLQIFEQADERMRRQAKRSASHEMDEGKAKRVPNPVGWRPA